MPSPAPIQPMPSLVVALTATGAESASARFRSISARWGPIRGASQISVASTFDTRPRRLPSATAQQVEGVGVSPALVVRREQRAEVPQAARSEHGVDHGVGEHVGVGMALEASLVRDLDAAEHQPAPSGEAVGVVADPDPGAHRPPGAHPSGSRRRSRRSNTAISSIPQSRIAATALS